MRYYLSLFVVFSIGALVLAAPTDKKPAASVKKEDVKLGDIYWPKLKFVLPRDSGAQGKCAKWRHPVIAVSNVDAHDKVKVAPVSHHPVHWESVAPASNYADIEGSVNLGPPKTVHVAHLGPQTKGVKVVRPGRLQPLIDHINANCPADKQLAGCEPSRSTQGNTAPSGSEHDYSKQGSQKSSSNKGSSSQGSRPGSPKKTSQESRSSQGSRPSSPKQTSQESSSSQGNQLGGSKQGSPPGSSDNGWQVVAGRRRNKARGSRNK